MFDTEHIQKTYLKLTIPVVLGMIITLIYNLADTYFIARTGNISLIAGVSVCSPIFTTLMAFGNIYGQGGSSLIARFLGKQDHESVSHISSFCFYAAIITGAVIGFLLLLFQTPFLRLLGASDEVVPYAVGYYRIMAFGAPLAVLSFIHMNLLRCEGMATQSMIGSLTGSVVNIILDPVLIFGLHMGAAGAAAATVIGYISTDLIYLFFVVKQSHYLSIRFQDLQISFADLSELFGIGLSAAVTNLASSLSVIILNHFLLPYGDHCIAAMGMVLKVNMIAQLVLVGLAFGGVPIYGYLYGSGNKKKLNELIRFCIMILSGTALLFSAALFLFADPIMKLFTLDHSILSVGSSMLRWQTVSSVFVAFTLLFNVLFQATGKVLPAMLMSISRQGILFLIVLMLFAALFGYNGVIMSQAGADLVSMLLGLLLYYLYFLRRELLRP